MNKDSKTAAALSTVEVCPGSHVCEAASDNIYVSDLPEVLSLGEERPQGMRSSKENTWHRGPDALKQASIWPTHAPLASEWTVVEEGHHTVL